MMFKRVKIIKTLRFMRGSEDDSQPAAKCAARKQKICVKRAYHETSSKAHISLRCSKRLKASPPWVPKVFTSSQLPTESAAYISAITEPHNCNKRGRTSRLPFFFSPERKRR